MMSNDPHETNHEMSAEAVIEMLGLEPHPEGGHFRETFRDSAKKDGRSVGTAIFFLLQAGEVSRWHKVDAAEIWHYYAGAPLQLSMSDGAEAPTSCILGIDLKKRQLPQHVIPTGMWQQARSIGAWTLVGCTVAPGFEFSGFEMAEEGWEPAQ